MSTTISNRPAPPSAGASRPRPGPSTLAAPAIDPFRVLRRFALAITASVFVGLFLGVGTFVALDRWYPLYTAEVLFEVRAGITDPNQVGTPVDIGREDTFIRNATTEINLLISRTTLDAAARNKDMRETEWHKGYFDDTAQFSIEDAVDDLENEVAAAIVRDTNLFSLKWSAHTANDARLVVNLISDAYLQRRSNLDEATFADKQKAFENQLKQTTTQIENLTEDISTFSRTNNVTIDPITRTQEAFAKGEANRRIAEARDGLAFLNSSYGQTSMKLEGTVEPTSEDLLEADQDQVIMQQKALMLAVQSDLLRLRDKYPSGDHPAIVEMERRLRSLEDAKDVELQRILNRNLNARLKQLADSRDSTAQLLEKLETELEGLDTVLRDMAANQSRLVEMDQNRELLVQERDDVRGLLNELRLWRERQDAQRVALVQTAATPREKSFPQPEIVIPAVTILVIGLCIGGIFFRELTDQRVKSASDLAVVPGARVLGVIPEMEEDPTKSQSAEMVLRKHPASVLAESYRQAAAPIAKAMNMGGHQILLLVGGLPGCGTTTVATNLAAANAAAGRRVLLVDANFRRPRLAEALGLNEAGPGLGDLLAGAATLEQVIVPAGDGIDLIRAGTAPNRVFERLHHGNKFDSLMAQLRERFDLILIDTPPAVVAGDALGIASKVDAAVLIVRASQEHRGLVARLINQLADAQCELIGVLLNRARGTAGGYFKKNFATMADYARSKS